MDTRNHTQQQKPAQKLAKQAGKRRQAKRVEDDALVLLGLASWLVDKLESVAMGGDPKALDELASDARMSLQVVTEGLAF